MGTKRIAALLFLIGAIATGLGAQPQYRISSLAGGGPKAGMKATDVYLPNIGAVAFDPSTTGFWVSSLALSRVIHIDSNGLVDKVIGSVRDRSGGAGDGQLATSPLVKIAGASAVVADHNGNLYVGDGVTGVRKVDAVSGIISTVAGNGGFGGGCASGVAATSTSVSPNALAVNSAGDLYISDLTCVRKVTAGTGVITTVAGIGVSGFSGDGGPATSAKVALPGGIAADLVGNIYFLDSTNHRIRMVSGASGIISTIAGNGTQDNTGDGGPATSAAIDAGSLAISFNRDLYLGTGQTVRMISAQTGLITSIPFPAARVLASDSYGNLLSGMQTIVARFDGITHTSAIVAGDGNTDPTMLGNNGPAITSILVQPTGVAIAPSGDVYVGDTTATSGFLRKITPSTGIITTVIGGGNGVNSGDGGPAANASVGGYGFDQARGVLIPLMPIGIAPSGDIFISDTGDSLTYVAYDSRIRRISAQTGIISTFAGGGTVLDSADGGSGLNARLFAQDFYIDGTDVDIADEEGHIRKINQATGIISTIASNLTAGAIDRDAAGNFYFVWGDSVARYSAATGTVSSLAGVLYNCSGPCDATLFGTYTGAQLGDGGPAVNARLNAPQGLRVDRAGNIYIADTGNHRIRYISAATGLISTIAGTNVVACAGDNIAAAKSYLSSPSRLALDSVGTLYVSDTSCGQIFKLSPTAGYIDRVDCQGVSGWAADRSLPGQSVQVSVFDGATLLTTLTANQLRADVGSYLGDNGIHGFSYTLPAIVRDGGAHNIRVVYGTSAAGADLPGSPQSLSCSQGYAGYVDSAACNGITGWIADRSRPNVPIAVSLWDGANLVASALAAGSRPDVGAYLHDNGLHGFSLSIPAQYQNGTPVNFQIHFESSTTQVPGSPLHLSCNAGGSYAGWLDHAGCDAISGWAANKPSDIALSVDIVDGATTVATSLANQSRPDVAAVIGGNGNHGFSIPTPASFKDGKVHTVNVRFTNTTQPIPNSPQSLKCDAVAPYTGYVDVLNCATISGWAADPNHLGTSVDVQIFDSGTLLGTVKASASRPDVGAFLHDNGLHGFSFPMPASIANGQPHAIAVRAPGLTTIGGAPELTCHP